MKLSELKFKEVINECNCKKLGYVSDLEFDENTGCICSIIVPQGGKCFNFFSKDGDYVIPYRCIKQIGDEIVLVSYNENLFVK